MACIRKKAYLVVHEVMRRLHESGGVPDLRVLRAEVDRELLRDLQHLADDGIRDVDVLLVPLVTVLVVEHHQKHDYEPRKL